MHDLPDPDQLLATAAAFLREQAAPALEGRAGFHARVMANVIDIARRQLSLAPAAAHAERGRLAALLGAVGDLETLNRQLCEGIRSGRVDADSPDLAAHLWQTTLDKLAVDQPRYAAYRRETGTDID